jgi:hypothetical protein
VSRQLIFAIGLLPLIAGCARQQPPASPPVASPAATVAATTAQADSEVEPAQASYAQVLQLQGVTFDVTSPNATAENKVTVSTTGLVNDNSVWSQDIDGLVTGAEVADLNVDGSPEVYVYVMSHGTDAKGSVVAYVANDRKSLSMASMPPLTDTPGAADGYRGGDEFAVLEGVLGRRFPIHGEGDTPTGKTRQLQYELTAGEAAWVLMPARITEF